MYFLRTFHRATLQTLRPSLHLDRLPLLIFVNKGIEVGTNALTLEIIVDTCGPEVAKLATFIVSLVPPTLSITCPPSPYQSGPSFAKESKLH
jgi:hypothetical protein